MSDSVQPLSPFSVSLTGSSIPGLLKYELQGTLDFIIPPGASTVFAQVSHPVFVSILGSGLVSASTNASIWRIQGVGPVIADLSASVVVTNLTGDSFETNNSVPLPLLGLDADPSQAQHLSITVGDTFGSSTGRQVIGTFRHNFAIHLGNSGQDSAEIRLIIEQTATLTDAYVVPEPSSAALLAIASILFAAGRIAVRARKINAS